MQQEESDDRDGICRFNIPSMNVLKYYMYGRFDNRVYGNNWEAIRDLETAIAMQYMGSVL